MAASTQANGLALHAMDSVCSSGRTVQGMRATINRIERLATENFITLMGTCTKGNGLTIKLMVRAAIFMLTVPHITVIGKKMNSMDSGKSHGQMVLGTRVSMTRDASMAMESWCFLKEVTTMGGLKRTRYADMVNTTGLMARTMLGFGLRTKWMEKAH